MLYEQTAGYLWEKVVVQLQAIGYFIRDQKGSHIHLRHPSKKPLTIPNHKEIARGTLRQILREADISIEEFLSL